MTAHKNASDVWEAIDWETVEHKVFLVQARIHAAALLKDRKLCHQLMRLIVCSRDAKRLAVHRVAEENRGANTAGIDRVKSLSPTVCFKLAETLSLRDPVDPVLRKWIPKKGSTDLRPLGIPTMRCRAQQALLVLALDPWFEALAETNVYGYRRGRGCADALYRIRSNILRTPRWVLDADIEKFFDRVNHSALLAKVDAPGFMKVAIKRMLKARIFSDGELMDSETGTPQGGVLSPLLANLALHGLQSAIEASLPRKRPVLCVRYADDFVVLADSRDDVEAARTLISGWLAPLGLNLKLSKTRITHTLHRVDGGPSGFEFLGVRVWQKQLGKYGGKKSCGHIVTLLHPSEKSLSAHIASLSELFRRTQCPEALIAQANRKIRGWCGYFRRFNSKQAFSKVDHLVWWISWKWGRRNFKWLGKRERARQLYPGGHWRFQPHPRHVLSRHAEFPIVRHSLVSSDARYYSRDWHYWATRRGRYPMVSRRLAGLLKSQCGRCAQCSGKLSGDVMVTKAAKNGLLSAVHAPTCP